MGQMSSALVNIAIKRKHKTLEISAAQPTLVDRETETVIRGPKPPYLK